MSSRISVLYFHKAIGPMRRSCSSESLFPISVQRCAISLLTYSHPRSVTSYMGCPNLIIQRRKRVFIAFLAFFALIGTVTTNNKVTESIDPNMNIGFVV